MFVYIKTEGGQKGPFWGVNSISLFSKTGPLILSAVLLLSQFFCRKSTVAISHISTIKTGNRSIFFLYKRVSRTLKGI